MPAPGMLGGPGLPDRVRIGEAQLQSKSVMESDGFGRFIKKAERAGDELMENVTTTMEGKARRYAPMKTGRLRRGIHGILLNGDREARLFSNVPYAGVMEDGSRPHLIHGVKASFTMNNGKHFKWNDFRFGPVTPDSVGYKNWTAEFGATVRHPGTRPHYFFKRAFEETFAESRIMMRRYYG